MTEQDKGDLLIQATT